MVRTMSKTFRVPIAIVVTTTTSAGRMLGTVMKRNIFIPVNPRSEEHTSELQSRQYLVCRLLLEKKKTYTNARCPQSSSTRKRTTSHVRWRLATVCSTLTTTFKPPTSLPEATYWTTYTAHALDAE